jgi:hypothetical protein
VALSPSEMQATIDLVQEIPRLELRSGKVTELRPGGKDRIVTHNRAVPEAALADRLGMNFKPWELSRARWKRPPPDSYFMFEGITVSRDQVLKLRPVPATTVGSTAKRRGGRAPQFNWDEVFAIALALFDQEGWPDIKSLRKYAKKICDACAKAGMEPAPEPDTVREKLSVWLSKRVPR